MNGSALIMIVAGIKRSSTSAYSRVVFPFKNPFDVTCRARFRSRTLAHILTRQCTSTRIPILFFLAPLLPSSRPSFLLFFLFLSGAHSRDRYSILRSSVREAMQGDPLTN